MASCQFNRSLFLSLGTCTRSSSGVRYGSNKSPTLAKLTTHFHWNRSSAAVLLNILLYRTWASTTALNEWRALVAHYQKSTGARVE